MNVRAKKRAAADRQARGLEMLRRVDGEVGEKALEKLREVAPDLARYVLEFPFGEIYQRPGLDLKSREIAAVAALAALGNAVPQLKTHIHGMLNVGCTCVEVVEVVVQMAAYAGFPAALNAAYAARDVFAARDRKGLS